MTALADLTKNPVFRFLAKFLAFYLLWYVLYEFLINPWGELDRLVINNSIFFTDHLLHLFGYKTFMSNDPTIRTIGVDGSHGIWIGDPCNGLALFSLFTCFMLALPGPWKHKTWFIPAGILVIHFLNILRITALCIIAYYSPEWLAFNHTYTFTILVYAFIFYFWILWVQRFFLPTRKRP